MAVAFDAQTASTTFNTSPFTFVHTPVGTPRGVTVGIDFFVSTGTATAVSYGGVALTKIISQESGGGLGENGRAEIWFLGAGLPTGAQTVSITHNVLGIINQASSVTVTATGDTEIADSDFVVGIVDDPSLTSTSTAAALRHGVCYTGLGDLIGFTPTAGITAIGSHSNGFRSSRHDRQTSPSSGGFTFGYSTPATSDVALVVVAVQQVSGPPPPPPPVSGGNRMGGSGAIRKPPRNVR